jgi:hypothetical protein
MALLGISMNGKTFGKNYFVKSWMKELGREAGTSEQLISYVEIVPSHDLRYN